MAINLYSKASVDSLLTAKLSISSLSNAAATTLNGTAPTTGQVLSFDGTELKWATPAGGGTWGSITGTLSSQTDLNTALNARVSTAGDTMDNNALLEFNDTVNLSHLGINGNGVTVEGVAGLAGLSSNLNMDRLSITDGTDTAEFGLSGIEFADGTTQTTAYTGGATYLGDRISIYAGYLYNEDNSAYVSTLTLSGASTMNAQNFTLQASGGGVLTFSDATTQSTAAIGIPTAGATGQVLTKNSGTNYDVSWVAPSGCVVNTYGSSSTSGSFTWTKPAGAKWVEILLYGGGGGGGSGSRRATLTARGGGAAGGGAGYCHAILSADFLSSTESVSVGAGGTAGTAQTVDSSGGNNGGNGGNTTFKDFRALGGNFGSAGNVGFVSGGAAIISSNLWLEGSTTGSLGGSGQATAGGAGSSRNNNCDIPTGGGGGAGAGAASTTNASGGDGAGIILNSIRCGLLSAISGGTGGSPTTPTQATAGTSATTRYFQGGTGGGGGYYKTAAAGGTGGAGGWPGGGGGGGGASDNSFASGAGGNGGNGFAIIITHF
jgi:hypothetical protein